MRRTIASAMLAALAACQTMTVPPDADIYHGFTLIDPATETVTPDAWLAVDKGRIVSIGAGPPPATDPARVHALTGRYVLPGFIDAHGHITTSGMQQIEVKDGAVSVRMDSIDTYTRHNARIALARGVTTIRNPGGDTEANARYDRMIASGEWIGPGARHAGAILEPPPFTGGTFAYPRNATEWDAEAARQKAAGMTYFKLYVDLTEAELDLGVRAAKRHGLIPIAHLNKVSWSRAIDLGIAQLEHALPTSADLLPEASRAGYTASLGRDSTFMYRWFELVDLDGPEIRGLIQRLSDRKIAVNLTLLVNDLIYNIDRIEDFVPPLEWEDMPPEVMDIYLRQIKASATGWTAEDFTRARAVFPKVLRFAKLIHDAGVPMMAGTDAGGGTFFYRELALHREAGIASWDVLRMATSDTAGLLGMGDRIGRIAPGFEADLVILEADPLADMMNTQRVHGVINNGAFLRSIDLRKKDHPPA